LCDTSNSTHRSTIRDVSEISSEGSPVPENLTHHRAPPAGLEPAPPAPEAGALSAELRGRERYKAGDDRSRHVATDLSGPKTGANAAVFCISMPTDHDVATAPLERHLLPRSASVDKKGHLRIGGLDLLELAEEFGTP